MTFQFTREGLRARPHIRYQYDLIVCLTSGGMCMNFSAEASFRRWPGCGLTALRAQVAGPNNSPLTFTPEATTKSTVAIVKGDVRRQIVRDALNAIDHRSARDPAQEIRVSSRCNNVSTRNQWPPPMPTRSGAFWTTSAQSTNCR
jgi:hypothetical protein